jgi:hypothetical protein
MLRNPKTTIAGATAFCIAAGHLLTALGHGDFSTIWADGPAIVAGIGLIFGMDAKGETK